ELQTDRARVTLLMIQTMLSSVEKRIQVEQQWMADECNRMRRLLQEAAEAFAETPSQPATALLRLAERARGIPEFPTVPSSHEINTAYRDLSTAFTEAMGHLNELVGEGVDGASTLLERARAYVQLRIERDMAGFFAMEGGMVGRG
ncbi:MAG: hypothetical protein HY677_03030, partial [Chloroflexi bacterium]|nr:hypothetical protein [Chloroflexota bacterium]